MRLAATVVYGQRPKPRNGNEIRVMNASVRNVSHLQRRAIIIGFDRYSRADLAPDGPCNRALAFSNERTRAEYGAVASPLPLSGGAGSEILTL